MPLCPFDVARTNGSTDTVFWVFVWRVVGKVVGLAPPNSDSLNALSLRKTSANPGAGTLISQELLLQVTVLMSSSPVMRPSESKTPPKV